MRRTGTPSDLRWAGVRCVTSTRRSSPFRCRLLQTAISRKVVDFAASDGAKKHEQGACSASRLTPSTARADPTLDNMVQLDCRHKSITVFGAHQVPISRQEDLVSDSLRRDFNYREC